MRSPESAHGSANTMKNGTHGIVGLPVAPIAGWPSGVRKTVCVCDTQPVAAVGLRTLLSVSPDLELQQATDSLSQAAELVCRLRPAVLVIDNAFGTQAILDWLQQQHVNEGMDPPDVTAAGGAAGNRAINDAIASHVDPSEPASGDATTSFVIWGTSVTEGEALRFLHAGAKGILRKTAGLQMIFTCLRTVAVGRNWAGDSEFRDSGLSERYAHHKLTPRERQVLALVEQGLKNKEIAQELGIQPSTVKIHLKQVFGKIGVRGRLGLAINGLRYQALSPFDGPVS